MKGTSPAAVGLALLLGAGGLLGLTGRERTRTAVEQAAQEMLAQQLGQQAAPGVRVETQTAPTESPAQSPAPLADMPEQSPKGEPVPVETVEEAWLPPVPEPSDTDVQEPDETAALPENGFSLEISNATGYAVDITELPALPEGLEVQTEDPVILIVHTHATEGYAESPGYRTHSREEGVMAAGDTLASALESRGYPVYHDRTLCDEPDFNDAYNVSRQVIRERLEEYPSLVLVIDLHRDAAEDEEGEQVRMTASVEGRDVARIMLVVGTDEGGLAHPLWRQNLSLAAVLQGGMEARWPGLMRPVNLRPQRFNQDLGPLNLLVEVGSSGCAQAEALAAAELLGQGLADLLDAYSGNNP